MSQDDSFPSSHDESTDIVAIREVAVEEEKGNTPESYICMDVVILKINVNVNIKLSWQLKELFDSLWNAIRSTGFWIEPVSNYLITKFRQVRLAIVGKDIVLEDKKSEKEIEEKDAEIEYKKAQKRNLDAQTEAQELENQKQRQAMQPAMEEKREDEATRIQHAFENEFAKRGIRFDEGQVDGGIRALVATKFQRQ